MQYQLGWLSKDGSPEVGPTPMRLYGSLCIEAACSVGDSGYSDYAGAAVELLVNSVLVHEQMQTSGGPSREKDAVWWVWGPAQAINVGDSLHALGRLTIFELQAQGFTAERTIQAVACIDRCSLSYYEGQYLDLTYQERLDVSEAQYDRMVMAKKGSMLISAVQLGALVAGADEALQEGFRNVCLKLGLAIQIRDDIDELWPTDNNAVSFRVMNKSKLLPVIHAFEHATLQQKKALGSIYFKRVMDFSDLNDLRIILEEVGSKEYAEQKLNSTVDEAHQLINSIGLVPTASDRWVGLVNKLTGK